MLFYFTGTGNSLYATKKIEDNPISIPQVIHNEDLHFTADSIGIVTPIYGHEVPPFNGVYSAFLPRRLLSGQRNSHH